LGYEQLFLGILHGKKFKKHCSKSWFLPNASFAKLHEETYELLLRTTLYNSG
jgi:hypothetical protein